MNSSVLLIGLLFLQFPVTFAARVSGPQADTNASLAGATSRPAAPQTLVDWLSRRCPALQNKASLKMLQLNLPRLTGALRHLSDDGLREQKQMEELIKRTHMLAKEKGWKWADVLKSAKRNPVKFAFGAGALALAFPSVVAGTVASHVTAAIGLAAGAASGLATYTNIKLLNISANPEAWDWKEESEYFWERTVKELLPLRHHIVGSPQHGPGGLGVIVHWPGVDTLDQQRVSVSPEHGLGVIFLETVDILSSYLADSEGKDTPPFFPDFFAKSRHTLMLACDEGGKDIEVCMSEMSEAFEIEKAASAVQLLGDDLAKLGIGMAQCGL